MRFILSMACLLSFAFSQEEPVGKVHSAVFSSSQAFWPQLSPPEKAASVRAAPGKPAAGKSATGKGRGRKSKQDALKQAQLLHLAVLPIRIRESDWKESRPCDSCHRLSANGMEFFLENYFKDRLAQRFPKATVELVAPHLPLIETGKLDLMAFQDSLDLPWARWFDGYAQPVIYRPRESMTGEATRKRLDRLGGLLGATHLLLPAKVWFKIDPVASNVHLGALEWGFHLVFWNVATGRAEWAQAFSESAKAVDLDAPLEGRLDRSVVSSWDRMPADLMTVWKSEPH